MSTTNSNEKWHTPKTHDEPILIDESDFNYNLILGAVFNTDVGRDNLDVSEPMSNTFFTSSHTSNFVHYCKLMDLCQKLGTTLEGFGLILEWAQSAYNNRFNFNSNHPSQHTFIQQLKNIS